MKLTFLRLFWEIYLSSQKAGSLISTKLSTDLVVEYRVPQFRPLTHLTHCKLSSYVPLLRARPLIVIIGYYTLGTVTARPWVSHLV